MSGAKILLVEDNEMNRDMLSRRLERQGYVIVAVADAEAGVRAALAEAPDLILMDLELGDMDGWEAIELINATLQVARIPVIMVTATDSDFARKRSLELGCADFDTKPIVLERLVAKIEACLKEARKKEP